MRSLRGFTFKRRVRNVVTVFREIKVSFLFDALKIAKDPMIEMIIFHGSKQSFNHRVRVIHVKLSNGFMNGFDLYQR